MDTKVIFPREAYQHDWKIHYLYYLDIFKHLGWEIEYDWIPDLTTRINGKQVYFDYGDSNIPQDKGITTFKSHYVSAPEYFYPFAPISHYNWNYYYQLEKQIKYEPTKSKLIVSRQRPHCNNLKRRKMVQRFLKETYKDKAAVKHLRQADFWKDVENIKVAVCAPGFCNNMLDRGQLQYMSFGVCTISPNLPETLPYGKKLIDKVHYIRCKDDYSDLKAILDNFDLTRAKEIGYNAKELFNSSCVPEVLGPWILSKI